MDSLGRGSHLDLAFDSFCTYLSEMPIVKLVKGIQGGQFIRDDYFKYTHSNSNERFDIRKVAAHGSSVELSMIKGLSFDVFLDSSFQVEITRQLSTNMFDILLPNVAISERYIDLDADCDRTSIFERMGSEGFCHADNLMRRNDTQLFGVNGYPSWTGELNVSGCSSYYGCPFYKISPIRYVQFSCITDSQNKIYMRTNSCIKFVQEATRPVEFEEFGETILEYLSRNKLNSKFCAQCLNRPEMQHTIYSIREIRISLQHFADAIELMTERACEEMCEDLDDILTKNENLLSQTVSALVGSSWDGNNKDMLSVDAGLLTLREVLAFYTNDKGQLDTQHCTTLKDLVNNCERELRLAKGSEAHVLQKTGCMRAATALGEIRHETALQKELRTKFVTVEEEEMSLTELQKLIEEEQERQKLLNDLATLRSRRT